MCSLNLEYIYILLILISLTGQYIAAPLLLLTSICRHLTIYEKRLNEIH